MNDKPVKLKCMAPMSVEVTRRDIGAAALNYVVGDIGTVVAERWETDEEGNVYGDGVLVVNDRRAAAVVDAANVMMYGDFRKRTTVARH